MLEGLRIIVEHRGAHWFRDDSFEAMITLLNSSENLLNLRDGVVVGEENLQRDTQLLCSRFGASGVCPLIIVISRNERDQHLAGFVVETMRHLLAGA
jgi:hypothetical protein